MNGGCDTHQTTGNCGCPDWREHPEPQVKTRAVRTTCRLFHDWTKWGRPAKGSSLWNGERVGDVWSQAKDCRRCGLSKFRLVYR